MQACPIRRILLHVRRKSSSAASLAAATDGMPLLAASSTVSGRGGREALSRGFTARTLASAFTKLLRYTRNKAKEHSDVKPQGKQTVKELIAQNQGVEKTELADKDEVKAFDRIAKQYGVDYAIKKGYSPEGKQRYILFSGYTAHMPLWWNWQTQGT